MIVKNKEWFWCLPVLWKGRMLDPWGLFDATVRSQVLIPRYFVVVIYNKLKQKQAQKPSI